MIHLVLGGARSGKSSHAEQLAKSYQARQVVYVATAQALDGEMAERISHHKARRPEGWQVIEEPLGVADVICQAPDGTVVLVDCLTLWLSNVLMCESVKWQEQKARLLQVLTDIHHRQVDVILVGNETGMGVVPMGELTRKFVDENGWLHQALAQIADEVVLCVAGLPLTLKSAD